MGRFDEIFILIRCDTSLSPFRIHGFQLCGREILHFPLNSLDNLLVIRQVWSMTLQTNHIECRSGFEGAVDVKKLLVLGLVKIGRHSSISI